MSELGNARTQIKEAVQGIVYQSSELPVYEREPQPGTHTAPFLSVWWTGNPDHHTLGFELRLYTDPSRGLEIAQETQDELVELIEPKIRPWFSFGPSEAGFADSLGLLVVSWPLVLIREVQHL